MRISLASINVFTENRFQKKQDSVFFSHSNGYNFSYTDVKCFWKVFDLIPDDITVVN